MRLHDWSRRLLVMALGVIYFSIDDVDRAIFCNLCKKDGVDNNTIRLDVENKYFCVHQQIYACAVPTQ